MLAADGALPAVQVVEDPEAVLVVDEAVLEAVAAASQEVVAEAVVVAGADSAAVEEEAVVSVVVEAAAAVSGAADVVFRRSLTPGVRKADKPRHLPTVVARHVPGSLMALQVSLAKAFNGTNFLLAAFGPWEHSCDIAEYQVHAPPLARDQGGGIGYAGKKSFKRDCTHSVCAAQVWTFSCGRSYMSSPLYSTAGGVIDPLLRKGLCLCLRDGSQGRSPWAPNTLLTTGLHYGHPCK